MTAHSDNADSTLSDYTLKPEPIAGERPPECCCSPSKDGKICWYCCMAVRSGDLEFEGEVNHSTGEVLPPKPAVRDDIGDNSDSDSDDESTDEEEEIDYTEIPRDHPDWKPLIEREQPAAEFDVSDDGDERETPDHVKNAGVANDGEHLSIQMLADPPAEYRADADVEDADDSEDDDPAPDGPEDLPDWVDIDDVPRLPDDPNDRVCDECGKIGFWTDSESYPLEAGWRDPDSDNHDPEYLVNSDNWECAADGCHAKGFYHRKTAEPRFKCRSPHCGRTEFDAPEYCGPVGERSRDRLLWKCGCCGEITLGPWKSIPDDYWDDD